MYRWKSSMTKYSKCWNQCSCISAMSFWHRPYIGNIPLTIKCGAILLQHWTNIGQINVEPQLKNMLCWAKRPTNVGPRDQPMLGQLTSKCWTNRPANVGPTVQPMLVQQTSQCWANCPANVGPTDQPMLGQQTSQCWTNDGPKFAEYMTYHCSSKP